MIETPTSAPSDRLWNRNFLLLWQGQVVSQLGNQAFMIAMQYWILRATGSATLMGLMLAASALPGTLLSPLGGAFADRFPRLRIVFALDLLSGLAMLVPAFCMLATSSPRLIVPILFGVSVLLGVVRAFFSPALLAEIPELVTPVRLAAANSVYQLASQGSLLVGQALGGVLYRLFGAPLLFLGNAISFFLSAGCTALIRRPSRPPSAVPGGTGVRSVLQRFRTDILDGLRYARQTRGFLAFLFAAASFNFFIMPILVLLPIYVEGFLHAGPEWYGFLLAGLGGGFVLGFLISGLIRIDGRTRARVVTGLMLLAPAPCIAIGLVSARPAALLMSVLLGSILAVINVQHISILQATTPPEFRGRILSLNATVASSLTPLGMVLGGIAGDLSGKNIPLVYAACGAAAFFFEVVLILRRSVFAFLSYKGRPESARAALDLTAT